MGHIIKGNTTITGGKGYEEKTDITNDMLYYNHWDLYQDCNDAIK
ncbi:hypothetical protein bsdtb5_11140 [Anaeromicropila herbilytica]|uniref:Uncharacterized protein n=1 Tax=Anaeromicropila herbilytica TaxID=2785025 RepID=A0A7R7EJF4_9FIRM|nr:hypothetical protein bsdtb5_11140 [Anaeromicropila herbilytica]